jgi:hypothetical protein
MASKELMGLAGVVVTASLQKRLSKGAMPKNRPAPLVNVYNAQGQAVEFDNRVKIALPQSYVDTTGIFGNNGALLRLRAIIFPYTPSIGFEHKASYATQNPLHSNFTQYFYQHSSVSPITISGKFTVENDDDAGVLLATISLLRGLVKMPTAIDGRLTPGSPPPVCRLKAYGDFMLENIPVVVTSFKHELPDNVDYYTVSKFQDNAAYYNYNNSTVPTISTISVTLNPVYSRDEMQKFGVESYINGRFNVSKSVKGYL